MPVPEQFPDKEIELLFTLLSKLIVLKAEYKQRLHNLIDADPSPEQLNATIAEYRQRRHQLINSAGKESPDSGPFPA